MSRDRNDIRRLISIGEIVEALRRHGTINDAARVLGCSKAYVRRRLKEAGLPVQAVVASPKPRAKDDARLIHEQRMAQWADEWVASDHWVREPDDQ